MSEGETRTVRVVDLVRFEALEMRVRELESTVSELVLIVGHLGHSVGVWCPTCNPRKR